MTTGQAQSKVEQEHRPAATVREKAQEQLRNAAHIFLAYTTADLGKARDLRSRILKLRSGKNSDTVFMASDSIQAGKDTDPSFILAKLKQSDLFVLACGSKTAESRWVNQEVEQALLQRKAGTTEILPVILKAGISLPPRIDFAIQGIHLVTLFPAIRLTRIALSAALMALAGTAVAFFLIASQRAKERDRQTLIASQSAQERDKQIQKQVEQTQAREVISLQAKLQKNADTGHFQAIDFAQRNWLLEQRKEAVRLNAQPEIQLIDSKLSRYATPELRKTWLPADANRLAMAVDPKGKVIWLGYKNRIEKHEIIGGKLLGAVNLGALFLVPYRPASALQCDSEPPPDKSSNRSPARLLRLWTDSRARGVLAEVQYDNNYACPGQVEGRAQQGYDSNGSEREILLLSPDSSQLQSIGLLVELTAERDSTGDLGVYDKPVSHANVIEAVLSESTPEQRRRVMPAWQEGDKVSKIAVDPQSGDALFHVVQDMSTRDDGAQAFSYKDWRNHSIVLLRSNGKTDAVTAVSKVSPGGARIAWPDGPNPFVANAPNYEPAVIGLHAYVVGYRLQWAKSALGEVMPLIAQLWFANDQATLRIKFADKSIAAAPSSGKGPIHRFVMPENTRAMDLSADGNTVFVLNADGGIDSWDIRPFGQDGWIAQNSR